MDKMKWIDEKEAQANDSKDYFNIVEGDNRFQVLTYIAPQALKWTGTKYEPAVEGDTGISIKGVCWVLQDGAIKLAKLPYTAVKAIRTFQNDEETRFEEFPMPYAVNIKAKDAGTKEVEYQIIPSRKESPVEKTILDELAKKPTPEEMVEKMKVSPRKSEPVKYPEADSEEVPF